MANEEHFISRELSWLEFNARVLDEAGDSGNPLLERLKFIAIFSSNLDEFFMVRVAALRKLVKSGIKTPDMAGNTATEQLAKIRKRLNGLIRRQHKYLAGEILPGLEAHNIFISDYDSLNEVMKSEADNYFISKVLPVLTPLAIDPSHPFPILNNGAIEIAVWLRTYDGKRCVHALVEVPELLPRFVPLASAGRQVFVTLEHLIMGNLSHLFRNCEILDKLPFRITRDMDFSLDEEGVADLLQYIKKELLHRRTRAPIRLQIPGNAKGRLVEWLQKQFDIEDEYKYVVNGPMQLSRLFELVGKIDNPELIEAPWPPLPVPHIDPLVPVMRSIERYGDIGVFVPYQEFDPVVRLLNEASEDPEVLAIKQTLYRVSGNSPVVAALRRAAENGKQVTVIVELKARFDEDNNILWARRLEESGAHVVYGIAGLKIHSKALLVIRNERGVIKRYCHLGTGNYNDKTARIYTDFGLFTKREDICTDIAALFNVMTGYSAPEAKWAKIAAAPFDLRQKFLGLIDREARMSSPHEPGKIIAKMNSLVDPEIIGHLYAAAEAGVQIDLIVRGMCCMKPVANIRITSIVDRYLEHTRVYYFLNGGEEEYYCSSADWMSRNLDRRVEILFPVESEEIRRHLRELLRIQLEDSRKGRRMKADGGYTRTKQLRDSSSRSQFLTYKYFERCANESATGEDKLKIFRRKSARQRDMS